MFRYLAVFVLAAMLALATPVWAQTETTEGPTEAPASLLSPGLVAQVVERGVLRDGVTPYVVVLITDDMGTPRSLVILIDAWAIETLLPRLVPDAQAQAAPSPPAGPSVAG